jgi:hypothetical protein
MINAYPPICRAFIASDIGRRRCDISQFEETDRQFKQAAEDLKILTKSKIALSAATIVLGTAFP